MSKKVILFFVVLFISCGYLNAQQQLSTDSVAINKLDSINLVQDSVSLKAIDTITPKILKPLDSLEKAKLLDSLSKVYYYGVFDLQKLIDNYQPTNEHIKYQVGDQLPKGDMWILAIVAFLLVLFAVLKNTFSKQLGAVVQSFYSNRALTGLNKEENLLTSWSFLLLFVQFGFTIGMFFYLAAQYKHVPDVKDGFKFFVVISIAIICLYLLKIIILRLLGFVFNIQKPLNEYVSILYLSYFNASLLFIPLITAFALSPLRLGELYINLGIVLLTLIFVFQFIRAGVNILSQYRFSKVYLFLYFCTLEICPILILIKAVGL